MKKPNIFKGRTKEWDENSHQGKTKKQISDSEKIIAYAFIITLSAAVGYGLVNSIIHLFI